MPETEATDLSLPLIKSKGLSLTAQPKWLVANAVKRPTGVGRW